MPTFERTLETARYEIKAVCNEIDLPQVRAWVYLHPDVFVETYPPRQVNTLYFDTYDLDCFSDHLNGATRRSKLRFRWYGQDYAAVEGALELKCKENYLGWKLHIPIPETFDLTSISWRQLIDQLQEHARDVALVYLRSRDRPALLNSYVREYYESIDGQVRVTIDHHHHVYDQLTYSAPNLAFRLPDERRVVVEVKSSAHSPRRASSVLSCFPFQVEQHSKYLDGMMNSPYV